MKKMILGILFAASLLQPVSCLASETISVEKNAVQLYVDGKKLETDSFLYQGTTYVPIRAVSEGLNANVQYNGQTSSANITNNSSAAIQELRFFNMYYAYVLHSQEEDLHSYCSFWSPDAYFSSSAEDQAFAKEHIQFLSSYISETDKQIQNMQFSLLYPASQTVKEMVTLLNNYQNQLLVSNINNDQIYFDYVNTYEQFSTLRLQFSDEIQSVTNTLLGDYAISK